MAYTQHLHHHYQYILRRWVRMHLIPGRYLSFKPEECFKLTIVHNIQQKRVVLQQQNTWLSLDISMNQVVHICCRHEPHRRMSGLQKKIYRMEAWCLSHTEDYLATSCVDESLDMVIHETHGMMCKHSPLANGSCIAQQSSPLIWSMIG